MERRATARAETPKPTGQDHKGKLDAFVSIATRPIPETTHFIPLEGPERIAERIVEALD
jgi:hypothetical protein